MQNVFDVKISIKKKDAQEYENGPSNVVKKAKKEYFCPICQKEYQYIGALLTHLKNSHGLTADEINNFHSTTVENSLIVSSTDKFKDDEKVILKRMKIPEWEVLNIRLIHSLLLAEEPSVEVCYQLPR